MEFRHEVKHLIHPSDRIALRQRLRAVMQPDPHAIGGRYKIRSLYFDTPVSGGMSDRPMVAWIFNSEEYTEQYHALFAEFLETFDLEAMIDETAALIAPYVEKDPTAFCTYEEFETGVETLKSFCTLREESVKGQLDGTIPSTQAGQSADSSSLIDTTGLNLSAMGSMGGSGGGFGGNSFPGGR